MPRPSRKNDILEALAKELESNPGDRITTALLAKSVGVSEAALYRHFPSKARMFESLLEFAEEAVFARINQILDEESDTRLRCSKVIYLMLGFSDRNPGITRVLLGDALQGEHERLHERVENFFQRLETQFRQILREATIRQDAQLHATAEQAAQILVAFIEGRMHQFLRTRFKQSTTENWDSDWKMLHHGIFIST